jgi:hypothetical protein
VVYRPPELLAVVVAQADDHNLIDVAAALQGVYHPFEHGTAVHIQQRL